MNANSKPWYASKTIISSAIAIIAMIASIFGFEISGVAQAELADLVLQSTAIVASIFAIIGRLVASKEIE